MPVRGKGSTTSRPRSTRPLAGVPRSGRQRAADTHAAADRQCASQLQQQLPTVQAGGGLPQRPPRPFVAPTATPTAPFLAPARPDPAFAPCPPPPNPPLNTPPHTHTPNRQLLRPKCCTPVCRACCELFDADRQQLLQWWRLTKVCGRLGGSHEGDTEHAAAWMSSPLAVHVSLHLLVRGDEALL